MVRALLVTHGLLGRELLRTAEGIIGPQAGAACVSNSGFSIDDLTREITGALQGEDEVVLFIDLLGGSCGHACRRIRQDRPRTALIAGVNLPMLLDFFCNRQRLPFEELIERLARKGREGIRSL